MFYKNIYAICTCSPVHLFADDCLWLSRVFSSSTSSVFTVHLAAALALSALGTRGAKWDSPMPRREVTKTVVVFKFSRDWLTSKCKSAIEWSRYSSARPVVPGAWCTDLIKVLHKCQLYLEGTRTRSDKCEVQSIWKGSEAPLKGGRDKSFNRRNASSVFSGQGSCGSSSTPPGRRQTDELCVFVRGECDVALEFFANSGIQGENPKFTVL